MQRVPSPTAGMPCPLAESSNRTQRGLQIFRAPGVGNVSASGLIPVVARAVVEPVPPSLLGVVCCGWRCEGGAGKWHQLQRAVAA
jgi:hypothetical protein